MIGADRCRASVTDTCPRQPVWQEMGNYPL